MLFLSKGNFSTLVTWTVCLEQAGVNGLTQGNIGADTIRKLFRRHWQVKLGSISVLKENSVITHFHFHVIPNQYDFLSSMEKKGTFLIWFMNWNVIFWLTFWLIFLGFHSFDVAFLFSNSFLYSRKEFNINMKSKLTLLKNKIRLTNSPICFKSA